MKSHLAHIMPVWRACEILGRPIVERIVTNLLLLRPPSSSSSSSPSSSSSSSANNITINNSNASSATGGSLPPPSTSSSNTATSTAGGTTTTPDNRIQQEVEELVDALFYQHPPLSTSLNSSSSTTTTTTTTSATIPSVDLLSTHSTQPIPSQIAQLWKKWLSARSLSLDKVAMLRFFVPHQTQPHQGPSGHMGLFDCWVYALQGHATHSTATYYGGAANGQLVFIPDILILLAVAKQYRDLTRQARRCRPQQQQQFTSSSTMIDQQQEHLADQEMTTTNDIVMLDATNAKATSAIGSINTSASSHSIITKGGIDRDVENAIWTMSLLAYRIYDAYQKKGFVTRDTIHRFFTDVHGEDSYKKIKMQNVLDAVFDDPNHAPGWLHASISEVQFCRRVLDTIDPMMVSHTLLDWIALLGCSMIPEGSEIPLSVQAHFDTIHYQPRPLCEQYELTDSRLFEIKRRFHSLVQSNSNTTVTSSFEGDLLRSSSSTAMNEQETMTSPTGPETTTAVIGDGATTTASTSGEEMSSSSSLVVAPTSIPKHMILETAFCDAVSLPNEEMGHGGFMPRILAQLIFRVGCQVWHEQRGRQRSLSSTFTMMNNTSRRFHTNESTSSTSNLQVISSSNNNYIDGGETNLTNSMYCWGLYHVVQFGGLAVRYTGSNDNNSSSSGHDLPLLRFLFAAFQQTLLHESQQQYSGATVKYNVPTATKEFNVNNEHDVEDKNDDEEEEDIGDGGVTRVLSKLQVSRMLVALVEYGQFRLHANAPPSSRDSSPNEDRSVGYRYSNLLTIADIPTQKLPVNMCSLLGLMPPNMSEATNGNVTSNELGLDALVEYALQDTASKEYMTFDEFCVWNQKKRTKKEASSSGHSGPQTRLGPLMIEMRLIAAVLFGIPPKLASMEVGLIAEIERRHRARYPQTDVSRRGPRGTVWYIINAGWMSSWQDLVKNVAGTAQDGADGRGDMKSDLSRGLRRISNTNLLVENGRLALRPDIRWKQDYEILPPSAWSALQAWYDGGPPIYRTVVRYITPSGPPSPHSSQSRIPTENEIELYPFFVTVYLCDAVSRGEARPFQQNYQLSRVTPVGIMLVQLCRQLHVDPAAARLWVMGIDPADAASAQQQQLPQPSPSVLAASSMEEHAAAAASVNVSSNEDWILNTDQNIIEQRKRRGWRESGSGMMILLELKDKESGKWPRGLDGKEWAFREKSSAGDRTASELGDGIVGLYNMGNTCYMNASIQCLSHTPILRQYFTTRAYLKDINATNPLGYQGQLAQVSAVLINSLWKHFNQTSPHQPRRPPAPGSYTLVNAPSLTPKTFKDSLGKFSDIFAGNEQHDAQEFLAFLLGGLSEDLNRIVEKPYIEAPDSDGRPDSELANIWWSNHLKREMSIIVALFTGQYKSLLTCRTCKYESARFEPFSVLQLPLPEDDHFTVFLVLYPLRDNTDPMKYAVRVRMDGKLRDVLIALAEVIHSDENAVGDVGIKESGVSSESEEIKDSKMQLYASMSKNFVVVDMRDGYIAKIAPNSWSLQDLQNKDTGELPLLRVFELDQLPELMGSHSIGEASGNQPTPPLDRNVKQDNRDDELTEASSDSDNKSSQSFVAVAQRRSEIVNRELLHPLVHRVFGTPLLLRINELEKLSGREMYDLVARRLRNLVPRTALRFLSSKAASTRILDRTGDSGRTMSAKNALVGGSEYSSVHRTTTDMEFVAAGPVPRYGFRLRLTTRDGRRCLSCPWYECCIGCLIPDNDTTTEVMDGDSLVVDWHLAVEVATEGFGLRAAPVDPIVGQSLSSPPNRSTRPTTGVTIRNHASCSKGNSKQGGASVGQITLEGCLDAFAKEERIPEAYCSRCQDFRVQTKRMSLWRLPPIVIIQLKRFQFTQQMRRKLRDLVHFRVEGLDFSRILADEAKAVSQHDDPVPDDKRATSTTTSTSNGDLDDSDSGRGSNNMLYDLYGVVHHQGALSGGHYVASLKSDLDGQWRLFNDAQIYEVHPHEIVDSSAYILFYIRRDAAKAQLSDFWDVREGESGVSEEEVMDQLMKSRSDRCVIS